MRKLPRRLQLPDFAGRPTTLGSGPECWQILKEGADLLLFGLGPESPETLDCVQTARHRNRKIYWLEAPAIRQHGACTPPRDSIEVGVEAATAILSTCTIAFYRPGLRIAPEFWGPLLAKASLAAQPPRSAAQKRLAWLPGTSSQLLHPELCLALKERSWEYYSQDTRDPAAFLESLAGHKPEFGISVNFRGLDGEGRIFEICREAHIPLAIWLVDNPWNLLSGIPLPWWKEAHLFVSDASFIPELKRYGAKSATYLPLAASPHMFRARAGSSSAPPVFVGRSAFPARKQFFAATHLDEKLLDEAESEFKTGRPDFHWWQTKLQLPLWPGTQSRKASLGADHFSSRWRAEWIAAGTKFGLQLVGDEGWHNFLPEIPILPPVDYYGSLPDLYANAAWTLNATSLLLPESLNQRHFDVWAAGGFLFTDQTRGLELFPADLVEPVAAVSPADLACKLERFSSQSKFRGELAKAWREHIRAFHIYEHRLDTIAATLGFQLENQAHGAKQSKRDRPPDCCNSQSRFEPW